MIIEVTKKQNIRIDGVKYKAVPQQDCSACSIRGLVKCHLVPCNADERTDHTSVSFARKAPKAK